ncbi:hypothetical protein [Paracoccus mutanolyticus]|uniref:hypothetical protein n=1 Tax=Paracoccus mutanolyticus TaxID=1499308 RepID=UPI001673DC3B|nr:hypothetical protein [Paracoccus mutanolyticus]
MNSASSDTGTSCPPNAAPDRGDDTARGLARHNPRMVMTMSISGASSRNFASCASRNSGDEGAA